MFKFSPLLYAFAIMNRFSWIIIVSEKRCPTSMRVSMGLTVNRQMAKKLTVNRQKRNIFAVNRQMNESKLAAKFLRYA